MRMWKPAALSGALLTIMVAAGAAAVHGQGRERTPIARAFDIIGRGQQIGATVRDVEGDEAKQASSGVIVEDVRSESPADKAGIKAGDAILEFDGERVRSVRQFTRLVRETPAGRKVQAVLSRGGQRVTVSVAPERSSGLFAGGDFDFDVDGWDDVERSWIYRGRPSPPPPSPATPAPPRAPRPPSVMPFPDFDYGVFTRGGRLGISVETLTPQLREYFGVKDGVLVRSVTDASVAAKAGLKAGDVITAVNGSKVSEPSDVSHEINRLQDGDELSLEIVRDRKTQTLKGKIEPRQDRARTRTIV